MHRYPESGAPGSGDSYSGNAGVSAALLEAVVAQTRDAIVVIEPPAATADALRVVLINPAFTTMTGYTGSEFDGQPLDLLIGPLTDPAEMARVNRALHASEPCQAELQIYRKDRTPIWIDLHWSPLDHEVGHPGLVLGVARDITFQRQTEAENRERDARAMAVLESAVDAIISIDESGRIESANAATERMFGYAPAEILGRNIAMLMPAPYRDQHDGYIQAYLNSGVRHVIGMSREVHGWRKDGTTFPMRLAVSEVIVGGRRTFTGSVHDLSVEAELEERLIESRRMESLGTLAGGIAHDFNNILQSILGFSTMAIDALDQGDHDATRTCLSEIEKGSTRAANLVEQILTFSREAKTEYAPIDLHDTLQEACYAFSGNLPPGIRLETDFASERVHVLGDHAQFRKIIDNLALNAIRAMEQAPGILRITLRIENPTAATTSNKTLPRGGDYACITVSDTGAGMPPHILARATDPFFTTRDEGKGTGLGLAIVHGIVTRMNGTFSLESSPGLGTTATIRLPLARPEFPAAPRLAASPVPAPPAVGETDRILIVDDEDSIVRLFTQMLRAKGFAMDGFTDASVALEHFREAPMQYGIAVIDYVMPEISGIDLAASLHEINPGLTIFIASGMLDEEGLELLAHQSVRGVIRKPFRPRDLIEQLRQAIAERSGTG